MIPELKRLIEQMGKDRGIDKEVIVEALETAMITAARKKLGAHAEVEAHYNDEIGEVEVFQFKTVVAKVIDPETQISLAQARTQLDEEAEPGDSLGVKIETSSFGRIAAQAAKQSIIQRVKDAERDNVYEEFKDKKGELVNGFIQRIEGGNLIINLGHAEAIILQGEQIPRESYKRGDRIMGYIYDIRKMTKGPPVYVSRTHPGFLKALFEMEVPEIAEKLVEIVAVAREPGKRSKIAVKTWDRDIDPVGACVGMRGSRVQAVVQELKGEKIDIIPYSEDQVRYVCSTLAPAKVNRVMVDEQNRAVVVVVPDDQLSLAIGKGGQNVRLAVRLTGWKIDVKSESMAAKGEQEGCENLMQISGIGQVTAERLYGHGLKSIAMIASSPLEMLSAIPGVGEKAALHWIEEATRLIEEQSAADRGSNTAT